MPRKASAALLQKTSDSTVAIVATPPTARALAADSEPSSSNVVRLPSSVNPASSAKTVEDPGFGGGEATYSEAPSAQPPRTPAEIIDAIRETHRQRNDFVKAEGNLQRQVKAITRRAVGFSTFDPADERKEKMAKADALFKALEAGTLPDDMKWVGFEPTLFLRKLRDEAGEHRAAIEKQLKRLVKQTHVYDWMIETPGFGPMGLAQIIGEAGDLGLYANPAKLWKRMGVGLISNGQRQQCFTDKDKAIEAGYNPRRRSVMFVIGDSMIKAQGPYRELYLARKIYEAEKAVAAGKIVLPAAKIKKADVATSMSEMHIHRRAQRYMEKRLLRNLWRAWRHQSGDEATIEVTSPNGNESPQSSEPIAA